MTLGLFPAFQPDNFGGLEQSAFLAWQSLQSNHNPAETSAASAGPTAFCYGSQRFRHDAIAGAQSRPAAVWTALKYKWSADVVLIWHVGLLKLLPFFRLPSPRLVLFLHGIEAWRKQGWLTQRLLRRIDLVLTNSLYTWERFAAFYPDIARKPHRVIHLGLSDVPRATLAAPIDTPVAVMLGRMDKREDYKGHREMIAAWPAVVRSIPDAQLWIVGGGTLRAELEAGVSEAGLSGSIRFLGRVSEATKTEILSQCRCLALPSRAEGFGLVYLEAMRMGRPCIVSSMDAGREVVNPPEAGIAVDPRNANEIADAVCRLLTPGEEWEKTSRRARERYAGSFTGAHFQRRLLSALADLNP